MDQFILARVIHVLAIVLWIGGVAMVTLILLPAIRRLIEPHRRIEFFETIESRFAWQSRVTTVLAGGSGFYMLMQTGGWQRLSLPGSGWLHLMIFTWVIFTLMLFVMEPLVLHRVIKKQAKRDPVATFNIISKLHYLLLSLSLFTVAWGVAATHGFTL
jgi:uncharacterized membrane protein